MSTTTPALLAAAISGPSEAERERDEAHAILTAYVDRADLHMPWKTAAPEDVAIYRRACAAVGRTPKC